MTNLHTLDTARNYCERIIGMARGRVVFDGTPAELTAEAVHEIYGADQYGAGIDETMTSTSITIAHQDNEQRKIPSAGLRPLAVAEA
jgi:phosphonate transport system ATP-binding protein